MTDNDKAATYIGWKEGEKCQRRHNEFMDRCSCGADVELDERHDAAAPDMADPRNYMKALEGLPAAYQYDVARRDGKTVCMIWRSDRSDNDIECRQYIHEASVPVAALAALYDAEHPV